jgi:hypothetical protein
MHLICRRNTEACAEFNVLPRLRNAVRLPGMQADQAAICAQRRIVSIDGVEREIGSWWQMEDFRSGRLQLAAKLFMLELRGGEIGRVKESQVAPTLRLGGLVPSCGAG